MNILRVNTSMDPQTPATVQVSDSGEYLVTVLPIGERGIMSGIPFSQIHTVTDAPAEGSHVCFAGLALNTCWLFRSHQFNANKVHANKVHTNTIDSIDTDWSNR